MNVSGIFMHDIVYTIIVWFNFINLISDLQQDSKNKLIMYDTVLWYHLITNIIITMIYHKDLMVNLHVIKQFKWLGYGFKDQNHGFPGRQKMFTLDEMMRNYNGIELMYNIWKYMVYMFMCNVHSSECCIKELAFENVY